MYKIAVLGDYASIYGFATLGLDIYPVSSSQEGEKTLRKLAEGEYAVIYITEALAADIEKEIERYKERLLPAIILIPGRDGPIGLGQSALKQAISFSARSIPG